MKKPHAVCIPLPFQSHINGMLKLAKLLHSTGFHITFVNTDFTHQRILRSRGPRSLDGIPGFQFRCIPDGIPDPSDLESNKEPALIGKAVMNSMIHPFRDFLQNLVKNSSSSHQEKNEDCEVIPSVTCIVTDGFMSFATDWAPERLGIPLVSFFTVSACSLMGNRHSHALMDNGHVPLKDSSYLTNGYLDTVIDWIPGMNSIKLKELPTFIQTTDPEDSEFKFGSEAPHRIHKASAVVIHTFDALETDVLNAFSLIHPRVYAICPLQLLLDKLDDDDGLLASLESKLWKEDMECLRWLDSQEPDSVMYVNFGSVAHLSQDQLVEFAYGLANSDRHFLWALRPGMITGSGVATTVLSEIIEGTKGRGMVSAWCPQEQVLNHPATAGFLTHCGWNSVIESLSAGVPMLCWPCVMDQTTNCKYICKEWEVGLQLDSNAKRDEMKRLVREVLARDNIGLKLKEKAMQWKKLAHQATEPSGSSSTSFETLVNEILCEKEKMERNVM